MKVFLAILLIAGCAAAVPCPVLKNLKAQLQQGVQDLQAHAHQLIKRSSTHAKEDVAALIKDPSAGSVTLLKNLISDGRDVILTTTADINKISANIRAAVSQLEKVEAAKPFLPILDNFRQQLIATTREARSKVFRQMEQAYSQVAGDVKALLADPAGAAKAIQDSWKAHHDQFVSCGEKFVATVQQQIQDAVDKIHKQFE